MSDFDSHWADRDIDGGGDFDPPPDREDYKVSLIDAGAFVSKSDKAFVKTQFRVEELDQNGAEWTVLHGFKSQAQTNVTAKTCLTMGVDIDACTSLEQVDEAMKALVGQYFSVTVKTNGKFRNTYVNDDRPIAGDIPVPAAPGGFAASDGDAFADDETIPF